MTAHFKSVIFIEICTAELRGLTKNCAASKSQKCHYKVALKHPCSIVEPPRLALTQFVVFWACKYDAGFNVQNSRTQKLDAVKK